MVIMEDSFDESLDERSQDRPSRQPTQYTLTHKRFKRPIRQVPDRDRYGGHHSFDDVEGDENGYEHDVLYDDFDLRLLQQPIEDRMTQAGRGEARLSLAPRVLGHFTDTPPQAEAAYPFQPTEDNKYGVQLNFPHPVARRLDNYSFHGDQQDQQHGLDAHLGDSSSPAVRAAQRRDDSRAYQVGSTSKDPETKGATSLNPLTSSRPTPNRITLPHAPPVVQGIPLIPVSELPDRFRSVFSFPTFNAVQSKSFRKVYKSDDNFVLASPTGSGKTVILELAICRAVLQNAAGQHKIVYQAPIKALCSERQRDWQKKFNGLGLTCAELTGDTDVGDLRTVQQADVIITTPEKWDSITRKWKDHENLLRLIRLFLIDEVHILKEDRGATLETVVSRMKTIGTNVRFVALSATVPSLDDVAVWLGKSPSEPYQPAGSEKFGEEFRPIKLKKHICGYASNGNDYQFDVQLDCKLPDVISKFSERKPIMIFCFTRKSTVSTAKLLARWWASSKPGSQFWDRPAEKIQFQDRDLSECADSAVAFHNAGLCSNDRINVEKGYLDGNIKVICCTSTLAVGVNLPCHFAIIKNTMTFTNTGLQEYSDLEIMQMLGRAGRPQFDDNAVAVIMTRQIKIRRYETMVTGQDILESRLHCGLIDHLNAEINLGTIKDLPSARKWLTGTFLYVRLKSNPEYYKLDGTKVSRNIDEQLDNICLQNLDLLQEANLIEKDHWIKGTEFGQAMAQYYVQFETMKAFMGIPPKAQISELLSALAQAFEFREIRFRSGEKALYKSLNQSLQTRFPIPVTLTHSAHKVSLIIQSILGAADIPWNKETAKYRSQYTMEAGMIFKHAPRLIRCIIDCQLYLKDSVAANHALMIERSISARVWDDSPVYMKQIPDVGDVSVRKLINGNIKTIEELEYTEASRIEMLLNRRPPFGLKLLDHARKFPKVRVSVGILPHSAKKSENGVSVNVKVDLGFLNDKAPTSWNGKSIYVCLLCGTSDGKIAHFARISGQKLGNGQALVFPALLTTADQHINCYVMCNEIAGTMREASVRPKVPKFMFPTPKPVPQAVPLAQPTSNISKRRINSGSKEMTTSKNTDEFGDDDLDDDDLVNAYVGDLDFDHIDNYANPVHALTRRNTSKNSSTKRNARAESIDDDLTLKQLGNGRWSCNHKCKDKSACKHMCCRDGLDKPPKRPTKKISLTNNVTSSDQQQAVDNSQKTQTKLNILGSSKRKGSDQIEVLDMTKSEKRRKSDKSIKGQREYHDLHQLHHNIPMQDAPATISSVMHKVPAYCYANGGSHNLSFLDNKDPTENDGLESSGYGAALFEDLTNEYDAVEEGHTEREWKLQVDDQQLDNEENLEKSTKDDRSAIFDDDEDSLFAEALIGLADSEEIKATDNIGKTDLCALKDMFDVDFEDELSADNESEKACTSGLSAKIETSTLIRRESSLNQQFTQPTPQIHDLRFPQISHENDTSDKITRVMDENKVSGEYFPAKQSNENSAKMNRGDHLQNADSFDKNDTSAMKENVLAAFKDLEPWIVAEFGDIIELVDT